MAVELCPSSSPFREALFHALIAAGDVTKQLYSLRVCDNSLHNQV